MPHHSNAAAAAAAGLQADGVRRMKIQEDGGDGGKSGGLPERPGEQDCMYYMRTGACGYGSGCRYNHPVRAGQGRVREEAAAPRRGGAGAGAGDGGDRAAQQDCQYFLRTGTCKFGSICKYQHPQNRHDARPVSLNILGLPIRQDEKSCPYYMRNGSCKFGIACKFSHPPPATLGATFPLTGPSAYASAGSSMAPPSGVPIIGGYSPWALSRNPYMSSPGMPGLPGYLPVLPPSQGTIPGWNAYTNTASHFLSTDYQGTAQISNSNHPTQPGSTISLNLPERPDQPDCQFYMKTGNCKYGNNCKYHHPKERSLPAMYTLGPLGLPLRPGQAICSFYSMYGICRYGTACKFDHPVMGYYNYSMAVAPISDPSAFFPSQLTLQAIEAAGESSLSKTRAIDKSEAGNDLPNGDSKEQADRAETTSLSHNSPSSGSLGEHSD